jgi:hypothetical protein
VYVENPMESALVLLVVSVDVLSTVLYLKLLRSDSSAQYGEMLPSDGMGGKRFPNHHSEIVDHTVT